MSESDNQEIVAETLANVTSTYMIMHPEEVTTVINTLENLTVHAITKENTEVCKRKFHFM